MKKYILALDQGTTSSRAVLINHQGQIVATAQKEFKQIFPQPGWVEHNPNDIWSSQAAVITEVMAKASASSEDIVGIGITNQRETTVVWDRKTGQPICNAIVWQDRRTTAFCQHLKSQDLEKIFREKTGLLLDPYFSGTKLHWILHHVPGATDRAKRGELAFGTVDSWLIWKLTDGKVHITDVSNASRTLLYHIHKLDWDQEILDILEIPRSLLPEVKSSSGQHAMTSNSIFSIPIPICGIAGDQQAALFGQTCTESGMVKTTYGTGCFLLMNTGLQPVLSKHNLLTTIAYQIHSETYYALEGSVFIGGAVVQWLRDGLGIIRKSVEVEKLASSVKHNDGVYFVPAFTGLGAPHWDPYARGVILGISRGTTSAHIARAALEGIAFQVTDVLKAMEKDSGTPISELRVDGGVVASDLLMQFQSDLMNVPVLRPKVPELTALGAGYLAGLAIGFWKDQKEVATYWQLERKFVPEMKPEVAHQLMENWNKAIRSAQCWETKS